MNVFVTGMAGTGKSSIAAKFKARGISVLDMDHVPNLCSWVNLESNEKVFELNPDEDFMEKHDYICDIDELKRLIGRTSELSVVFGAVGDNIQFIPLFDKTFLLQFSSETMLERLQNRDTNDFGKDKTIHKGLLEWKKTFDDLMLKQGTISINAEQSLDKVVNELLEEIRK